MRFTRSSISERHLVLGISRGSCPEPYDRRRLDSEVFNDGCASGRAGSQRLREKILRGSSATIELSPTKYFCGYSRSSPISPSRFVRELFTSDTYVPISSEHSDANVAERSRDHDGSRGIGESGSSGVKRQEDARDGHPEWSSLAYPQEFPIEGLYAGIPIPSERHPSIA